MNVNVKKAAYSFSLFMASASLLTVGSTASAFFKKQLKAKNINVKITFERTGVPITGVQSYYSYAATQSEFSATYSGHVFTKWTNLREKNRVVAHTLPYAVRRQDADEMFQALPNPSEYDPLVVVMVQPHENLAILAKYAFTPSQSATSGSRGGLEVDIESGSWEDFQNDGEIVLKARDVKRGFSTFGLQDKLGDALVRDFARDLTTEDGQQVTPSSSMSWENRMHCAKDPVLKIKGTAAVLLLEDCTMKAPIYL